MYAPAPVRVINFDGRADDAVYAAQQVGRDVKIAKLFMPDGLTDRAQIKSAAQNVIARAEKNFELALADPNIRTILWDTVTEYASICKLAFDGTMEKVKEHSHGEPGDFQNQCIWRLVNRARKAKNTHLIFTARATEIWKDQKPTGVFKPQCPKAVKAGVDWSGQIRLRTTFGIPKPEFEIEVKDAGLDITQLGEVYTAQQWDRMGGPFVYSCLMNYPDSEMEEWQ